MTATMMLVSTLLIGYMLHLSTITASERAFVEQKELHLNKVALLVLGMKDTILYIQKSGTIYGEKSFAYKEGTLMAKITSISDSDQQIILTGVTASGQQTSVTFYYDRLNNKVLKWGDELG
ncbi:competence type IV pilus minor pilin ComGG [Alkalihalobacillus sp. CinArs1]|uniref:competence type IV pilus minor pilin ComGG n=1 Tax=Alkalihalobacillus sp. CinArs1 TaxID=2995314 RepID=UPI0022DE231E|nr:competence type IV pilus minor pilin ComGG [Alkalihalobacillus sp. CinArs1]